MDGRECAKPPEYCGRDYLPGIPPQHPLDSVLVPINPGRGDGEPRKQLAVELMLAGLWSKESMKMDWRRHKECWVMRDRPSGRHIVQLKRGVFVRR